VEYSDTESELWVVAALSDVPSRSLGAALSVVIVPLYSVPGQFLWSTGSKGSHQMKPKDL